ncbi:hypothetical protein GCM10020256_15750 [Streptomyces thermocoprophilus]
MAARTRRVELTPAAEELVRRLTDVHGPVMFHQSGGCCDGSAPMCYPRGEFRVGAADVLLGHVADDTPFWMSADQFAYWQHTHLTVDVVPGRGSGFSLEAPRRSALPDPLPCPHRRRVGTPRRRTPAPHGGGHRRLTGTARTTARPTTTAPRPPPRPRHPAQAPPAARRGPLTSGSRSARGW